MRAECVPMKRSSLKQVINTKRENKEKGRASGFRLLGNKSMLNRYGVIPKCLGLEEFTHWTIPLPQQFVKFIALIGQSRENYFAPFLPHKCPIMAHCCRTKGGSNREIKTETSCDQIENLSSPPSHRTGPPLFVRLPPFCPPTFFFVQLFANKALKSHRVVNNKFCNVHRKGREALPYNAMPHHVLWPILQR